MLSAESLATVRPATMVYEAELDRFLVPRFHGEWVASNLPAANLHRVPNAWHFAFMDSPSLSILSADGDVAANPPGFDRNAFLKQLADDITAFFDKTLSTYPERIGSLLCQRRGCPNLAFANTPPAIQKLHLKSIDFAIWQD
jgi:hypothetical protein